MEKFAENFAFFEQKTRSQKRQGRPVVALD